MSALAPATVEGWYALHHSFRTDWRALRQMNEASRRELARAAESLFRGWADPEGGGWSAPFRLVGGGADWLFVHFRPTLDALAEVELEIRRSALGDVLELSYDYLSVTEAGLYHATADAAREHEPGSEAFAQAIAARSEAERASAHVRSRLFPVVPEGMRHVCFYPMSKRRAPEQNWYALPVEQRSSLMREHGMTGRRYAGRIFQVISGSIGLDDWEWGVTLFARDPLEFKRIVTDMRFDQVSAQYAEFGRFLTGIRIEAGEWAGLLGQGDAA